MLEEAYLNEYFVQHTVDQIYIQLKLGISTQNDSFEVGTMARIPSMHRIVSFYLATGIIQLD